jgi:hypothetical protein
MFSCQIFEATFFSISDFDKYLRNKFENIKKLLNLSYTHVIFTTMMICVQLTFSSFSFFYILMFISQMLAET